MLAPDGELSIFSGNVIDNKVKSLKHEMAIDNFYLVADLIHIAPQEGLEISPLGVLGLVNAFRQAQKMIGN